MCELAAILRQLYEKQLHLRPEDEYLRRHVRPQFLAGSIRVFEFYSRHLPPAGRVLDWGCRHAPDACLIRARRPDLAIEACDLFDADHYPVFHRYADLSYRKLDHIYRLPYPDAAFDAIIASGVLEHVPMDYESLKELHRVLRPDGRLIITYPPNKTSVEEWLLRRRSRYSHKRLYSKSELRRLLLHTGFRPLIEGHQTQLDLLPGPWSMESLRPLGLYRFVSCFCAVALRVSSL